MAETQPQKTPPPADEVLQQPSDAVQLSDISKEATREQEATESGPSLPAPALNLPAPSIPEPAPTEEGKAKEETAASTKAPKEDDSLSIGPSDAPAGDAATTQEPLLCTITLLLPTGARHPYKIDEKYLAKRNVEIPDVTETGRKDPFSISVYKLKELILREWREDWEGKPTSPSSIRLIFFGKLLEDKEQLKKYHFSADSANIVHMSVRPPDMIEEDEAAKGKTSSRDGRPRDGGSGCCVIL